MKKSFQLVMFLALIVVGIVLVNNLLNAAGFQCECYNDIDGDRMAEIACYDYGHGHCIQVVPYGSNCIPYHTCEYLIWAYCQDGSKISVSVPSQNCQECIL